MVKAGLLSKFEFDAPFSIPSDLPCFEIILVISSTPLDIFLNQISVYEL